VIRFSRLSGLVLGFTVVVSAGGLGLHAVRDWHRHGEFGAGFFHLHFHVGEHKHHDHDDSGQDGHDSEEPSGRKKQRTAVLTLAQAFHHLGSVAPAISGPKSESNCTTNESVILAQITEQSDTASPRAPPV
jgi:hypothetical protein